VSSEYRKQHLSRPAGSSKSSKQSVSEPATRSSKQNQAAANGKGGQGQAKGLQLDKNSKVEQAEDSAKEQPSVMPTPAVIHVSQAGTM